MISLRFFTLAVGFVLDLCLGDPRTLPHPVVWIGRSIGLGEKILRPLFPKSDTGQYRAGYVLVVIVCLGTLIATVAVLAVLSFLNPILRTLAEAFICYQMLATKCLADAAGKVLVALKSGDLVAARAAVGEIVGRDTASMSTADITRATVETVAENTSDGVIAPLFYFAVGGAPLAVLYKAINTMDSMIGYKNDRYRHFGRAAAILDDYANFLPARLTGLLMIPAAFITGLDWRGARRIYSRDRRNHTSPNAGHPEAACAGALGVQLGGTSTYAGEVVVKPTLGDPARALGPDDIVSACRLLYATALLAFLACGLGLAAL
ncbi:MAG: adenosylcobinamide-phosphate synthase CbiB [Planctomycetes bacterium]|nr:adenosylcobinamide-phosphate synthase CbiB [Planctomycetota bacterium]